MTFNINKFTVKDLESKGYKVEIKPSRKVGEDVFELSGNLVKTQQIVNAALERMDKTAKEKLSDEQLESLQTELDSIFATSLAEQISNIIRERGARAHMTRRSQDVYVGYEEDPLIAIPKYVQSLAGAEAKKNMTLKMLRALTGTEVSWAQFKQENPEADYKDYRKLVEESMISQADQPVAFKWAMVYIKENTRNPEKADRVVGAIRGMTMAKYLAFRVFTAPAVNLTALPTSTIASMKGAGIPYHRTWIELGKGITQYGKWRWNPESLKANERWIFDHIQKKGWDNPQYTSESLAELKGALGRGYDKIIDLAMLTFSESEKLNRAATISGAFNGLKVLPQNKGLSNEKIAELAQQVSDDAHAVYTKGNRPYIAMGQNPAAHVANMFYVFQRFSHTYLLNMKKLGFEKKDFGALAHMVIAPAVIAGAGASIVVPIIDALLRGFGVDEPEEKLYRTIGEYFTPETETLVRFGLAGALGLSLKGSLAIGAGAIPTNMKELLGAPGSVGGDIFIDGIPMLAKGDVSKGVEKILPTGIGNIFKAYREHTEGMTTKANRPLFYGTEPVKLNTTEWLLKTLSFYPVRVAQIREEQWKGIRLEGKYREKRADIYAQIRKFYLTPVEERVPKDWADIMAQIHVYNEKATGAMVYVSPITEQSIRTNLSRSFKPEKRERKRAQAQRHSTTQPSKPLTLREALRR